MKKNFLVLFLILNFLISNSQDFNGGIFAGFSGSQIDGDTYAGYNKLGLVTGAFVNRDLSQRINLQFEMLYIQKGARENPNPDALNPSLYCIDLKYIELPLLVRYKLYKFQEKVTLEAGLSGAVLIKTTNKSDNYTLTEPYKKSDFSTNIGVNYKILDNLSINLRYIYSLFFAPIRTTNENAKWMFLWPLYISIPGQYNNVLALTLRYQFISKEQGEIQ